MLIGVSGKARAGKDSAADFIIDELRNHHIAAVKRGFADPVKAMYCDLSGVAPAELERNKQLHRQGLQEIGQGMREHDPEFWVRQLDARREPFETTIVADLRYLSEYNYIVRTGYCIRVEASPMSRQARGGNPYDTHLSEVELDGMPDSAWLQIFYNDGNLAELESSVRHFVQEHLPVFRG